MTSRCVEGISPDRRNPGVSAPGPLKGGDLYEQAQEAYHTAKAQARPEEGTDLDWHPHGRSLRRQALGRDHSTDLLQLT